MTLECGSFPLVPISIFVLFRFQNIWGLPPPFRLPSAYVGIITVLSKEERQMMRKLVATLFLLGTIVLFSAVGGNRVPGSGGGPEPCAPNCRVR